MTLGDGGPLETVCFHAQQCVEKYVKAVLTLHGTEFPRTHDIENLIDRLPNQSSAGLSVSEQRRLTSYATVMRYPGEYDAVTLDEARRAVEVARRARAELRRALPPTVCEE